MSAREAILRRIRAAQGRSGGEPTEAELAQVRAAIASPVAGPLPEDAATMDVVARFLAECDRVATTHSHAETLADVPREMARYFAANDLGDAAACWPELATLPWSQAGLAVEGRIACATDRVGVTGCFCAIAETGTLLLLSSPEMPKSTALLPETHVAIVSRARLVATMEDAFALLRRERGELPRSTWFVSGPSRTADIEQTLVIGAHGPYRVHVLLVP
jgi:L-lactate dehydrogenase complex protein LldG